MTVTPASLHFRFYPGATFSESLVLKDSEGVARDLTGYSMTMHVRREIDDEETVFELSTVTGEIELGADGSVTLNLSAVETVMDIDVEGEMWVHDALLSNDNVSPAVVERTYQGTIIAMPGVTR